LVNKQFAGKYTEVQEESELLNYKEDDKKIPFFITATCKGAI
jgi:isoleucyl-tRNA synthetase